MVETLKPTKTVFTIIQRTSYSRQPAALGVDPGSAGIDRRALKPIFDVRNKIIHELDINFGHATRNRASRSQPSMTENSNQLLEVAEKILEGVEKTLQDAAQQGNGGDGP